MTERHLNTHIYKGNKWFPSLFNQKPELKMSIKVVRKKDNTYPISLRLRMPT